MADSFRSWTPRMHSLNGMPSWKRSRPIRSYSIEMPRRVLTSGTDRYWTPGGGRPGSDRILAAS